MMRSILFLFPAILFMAPAVSTAQFSINPKAGLNYLWVGSKPESFSKAGSEAGWQIGGDLRIGKRFYFQPGFYLVRSGSAIQNLNDIRKLDEGKATHYKIPVNVGYKLLNMPVLKLRVFGGGVLTKFHKTGSKSAIPATLYKPLYYGANIGAGVDFLMFSIDAAYEMGLTNYFVSKDDSKPNMFMINVGVRLF